jgi:protein involved in polysaccharide export with SLBB domain
MTKTQVAAIAALLSFLGFCSGGCGDKFWDPTQVGRFRPVPAVNVILDSLGVADETPSTWEGAEEPRPADVIAYETDYTFGPGDIVRISIFELLQEGVPLINDYVVTETGKVSIPLVGVVDAKGLTESQLEEEIKRILSPSILKFPSVTVSLMSSQQRTFSISGNGVVQPGRFSIPRYDFRLLDAIAVSGGISQFNISYIYISQPVTGREAISETAEGIIEPKKSEKLITPEQEMLEIIAPRAQRKPVGEGFIITAAEFVTDKELSEAALPEGFEPLADSNQAVTEKIREKKISVQQRQEITPKVAIRETIEKPVDESEAARVEWIFQDGRWVPVQIGRPGFAGPPAKTSDKLTEPLKEKVPQEFGWEQIGQGGTQRRVIKIPTDRLTSGDPRYNVVIRPGDSIQVPVDIIGEFCIMGNVNSQGFVNLTGRPMTLKMAIASAGGLGPLAWPKYCEVIRRISKKKEEIVMVDLDKIAAGEQPDFFIKPNDLINVGTHPTARWRAVLRNAFRATYGFGFIYDRNFADRDFGTSRPIPNIF